MKNKIIQIIKYRGLVNTAISITLDPLRRLIARILMPLFSLCNRKKIIVFQSTPDFCGNTKYLYDYYLKQSKYDDYLFVWFITDKNNASTIEKNPHTKAVISETKRTRGYTLSAYYYMAKAEILYCDHSQSEFKYRKPNQIAINLWHGCGYKDNHTKTSLNWFDYALVPGPVFIKTKSKFWNCKEEKIIPIGYPRYDHFLKNNRHQKNETKTVIWMPTFRKTVRGAYAEESYERDYDIPLLHNTKQLEELNKECAKRNIKLIIKRHPCQIPYKDEKSSLTNIIFKSNEDLEKEKIDLYSLLAETDALISDYSSVSVDYLLLNKPIAFSLDDYDAYSETRGFLFENILEYMPGAHLFNYDDLVKFLESVSSQKDTHAKDRSKMIKIMHNPTKNYCKRIFEFVENEKELRGIK